MQGLFYLIVVETIFTFGYSVFNTFPQEIPTLLREIGDNLYQPGPYYISKMIELVRDKSDKKADHARGMQPGRHVRRSGCIATLLAGDVSK